MLVMQVLCVLMRMPEGLMRVRMRVLAGNDVVVRMRVVAVVVTMRVLVHRRVVEMGMRMPF